MAMPADRLPEGPDQDERERRAALCDAAIDRLIADLQAAGLPPEAIDRARAGFAIASAEIRAALRCRLPE